MAAEGFESQEEATVAFRANSLTMNLFPKGTGVPAEVFSPGEDHGAHSRTIDCNCAVKHLSCVTIN